MLRRFVLLIATMIFSALSGHAAVSQTGTITAIAADQSTVTIQKADQSTATLSVQDATLRAALKDKFKTNDAVSFSASDDGKQLTAIEAKAAPPQGTYPVTISSIAADQSSILGQKGDGSFQSFAIPADAAALRATVQSKFHAGDRVTVSSDDGKTAQAISAQVAIVSIKERIGVILGLLIVLTVTSSVLLKGHFRMLIVGKDNRYSNSKTQMALWFGVVMLVYLATVVLRILHGGGEMIGGVNVPQNLLVLSGLSVFTFGAAKGITSSNVAKAAQAAPPPTPPLPPPQGQPAGTATQMAPAPAPVVVKPPADHPDFFNDLLCDDTGQPDMGDFQMIVITVIAAAVFFVQVFQFLGHIELLTTVTTPDLDTTLLAVFGLGQGAYLTKKYVGDGA